MSYMRFGEDSDVYCYQESTVTTVEVAGSRILPLPEGVSVDEDDPLSILKHPTEVIDLPFAGQVRHFAWLAHATDFVKELKDLGYKVPEAGLQLMVQKVESLKPAIEGRPMEMALSDPTQVTCYRKFRDQEFPYALSAHSHKMAEGFDAGSMNILELMECPYDPLELPYAGEVFEFKDRASMLLKMKELQDLGYEISEVYMDKAREF